MRRYLVALMVVSACAFLGSMFAVQRVQVDPAFAASPPSAAFVLKEVLDLERAQEYDTALILERLKKLERAIAPLGPLPEEARLSRERLDQIAPRMRSIDERTVGIATTLSRTDLTSRCHLLPRASSLPDPADRVRTLKVRRRLRRRVCAALRSHDGR